MAWKPIHRKPSDEIRQWAERPRTREENLLREFLLAGVRERRDGVCCVCSPQSPRAATMLVQTFVTKFSWLCECLEALYPGGYTVRDGLICEECALQIGMPIAAFLNRYPEAPDALEVKNLLDRLLAV